MRRVRGPESISQKGPDAQYLSSSDRKQTPCPPGGLYTHSQGNRGGHMSPMGGDNHHLPGDRIPQCPSQAENLTDQGLVLSLPKSTASTWRH